MTEAMSTPPGAPQGMDRQFTEAATFFAGLQGRIVAALEELDGSGRFVVSDWRHHAKGGGRTCVLEGGSLLERAGVNFSDVGVVAPEHIARRSPGGGRTLRATGISLVLHPTSPMVPAVHANFRCISSGRGLWFGGGADLTPSYLFRDDVVHFHRTWKDVCDRHDAGYYPAFKENCDDYFFLPHRGEMRGVGGIFFDHLQAAEPQLLLAFVKDAAEAFLSSWVPIAKMRRDEPWGERERRWQLIRRGRYVEYNLLYDRGTAFGLETGGRTESIFVSMPPVSRWSYEVRPEPGSREAELVACLKPVEWLGDAREDDS